jgi:SAM-dependent methyltransferase
MNQGPDIASGFADVDATGAAASFVGYLDTAASLLTEHKRATVDALRLSLGDAALDVGCGIGDEVRVIAERVGPHGRAVGVDLSEDLLAQALQRTPTESCAEFISADAHALPFTDGMFAGARVERALQHMDNPSAVVREMSRVVCAGGRVVALEPDWDTLVLSGDDLATQRAIARARADSFRHPDIGRRLAALFMEAGLELRGLHAIAYPFRELAVAESILMLSGAVEIVGTDAAWAWHKGLPEQAARGVFCAALAGFVAVGVVPGDCQSEMARHDAATPPIDIDTDASR